MKGFLLTLVASAIAFVALLFLLPDDMIAMTGDIPPQLAVGAFIGLVNAVIKPIVKLLSLPITLMTLGLFSFVINAGMLLFSAWLLDNMFKVDAHDRRLAGERLLAGHDHRRVRGLDRALDPDLARGALRP